jgi:hypothetical protein
MPFARQPLSRASTGGQELRRNAIDLAGWKKVAVVRVGKQPIVVAAGNQPVVVAAGSLDPAGAKK